MNPRIVSAPFLALLLFASESAFAATNWRISPLQAEAAFTARSPHSAWRVPVKWTDGRRAYVLSFGRPELGSGGRLVGEELVLRRAGGATGSKNLLEPSGNWHGLQDYMFAADDLAKGPRNAWFGQERRIELKKLGLLVRITVLNAKVSPISSGDFQLDSLNLKIQVDNLEP